MKLPLVPLLCLGAFAARAAEPVATLAASAATLTAPLVLNHGIITQQPHPAGTSAGQAVFALRVPEAGDYVLQALVDAPGGDSNSWLVNIDAPPAAPAMIWDVELTKGFEQRIVGWRGAGNANFDEFDPVVFRLTAGEHRVIVAGREPSALKAITLLRQRDPSPAPGTLAFIQREYEKVDRAHWFGRSQLNDTPEGEKQARALSDRADALHGEQFMAAVEIAAAHPNSPIGFEALNWTLLILRSHYLAAGRRAFALMTEQYAAEPAIANLASQVGHYLPYPDLHNQPTSYYGEALAFLHAVIARNPDRVARGQAVLGLATLVRRKFDEAEARRDPVALAAVREELENTLATIKRDYGDCPNARASNAARATLGQVIDLELADIRHLGIGQVAPDIVGTDLDGKPFKLSDARGRVVLVVFWASWCGPCMAAVPHEKELLERFKGRPFAVVGVNADYKLNDAIHIVAKNGINWRSFWNGQEGPDGPIAAAWNVQGWPTTYLLDAGGVIREKYLFGDRMDAPIEELVRALERTKN